MDEIYLLTLTLHAPLGLLASLREVASLSFNLAAYKPKLTHRDT
jgi:hypothetical protein